MRSRVMQMAKLPPDSCRKQPLFITRVRRDIVRTHPKKTQSKHHRMLGLTLIEVLIALAIVAIALTAIIKTVSESIRSTAYLSDKTIAMYVGQQVLNESRVGLLKLSSGDAQQEKTTMLGKEWFWRAEQTSTPNPKIKKIMVNVFTREPDSDDASPIMSLESYLYRNRDE